MKICCAWLEWIICQTGVKKFISFYLTGFLASILFSIYTQSFLFTLSWAVLFGLIALMSLALFASELSSLKTLLDHVGVDAAKQDALSASKGLFSDIKHPLLHMLRAVSRKDSEFSDVLKEIAYSSSELSKNAETLSTNTTHQSDSTGSTAAAVTEIGQSIEEVTSRIRAVLDAADRTRDLGDQGTRSIDNARGAIEQVSALAKQTQTHVSDLGEASKSVSTLSDDIVGIADQTSLLALNAAIEAARAGEYGRGFSVVADEVRALAVRSQKSAKDISENINQVNGYMSGVESSMNNVLQQVESCLAEASVAVEKLKGISNGSESVSTQIHAIAVASEQQASAAKEISSHIERVAVSAQENSYMAKQTAEVASYLVSLASNESTA